jgi:hypothetical protein
LAIVDASEHRVVALPKAVFKIDQTNIVDEISFQVPYPFGGTNSDFFLGLKRLTPR